MKPDANLMDAILRHGQEASGEWIGVNACADALALKGAVLRAQLRFCADRGYVEVDSHHDPSRFRVTFQGYQRKE